MKNKKYIKFSELVKNRWKYINYVWVKKWKTNADIIYYIDFNNKNEFIIIPKWFEFDFNSSPPFFHWIIDRDEFAIALIHDFLYSTNWKVIIKNLKNLSWSFKNLMSYRNWFTFCDEIYFIYNRKFADIIWLQWAIAETREIQKSERKLRIFLGYLWIRLFGGGRYKKDLFI